MNIDNNEEKWATLKCDPSKTFYPCFHTDIILVTIEYEGEESSRFVECADCHERLHVTSIIQETRKANDNNTG
jgi:uncharacterized CHY-type Zn-finger protein